MSETDALLTAARECAEEGLEGHALRRYRRLDKLLSEGAAPLPEAWRQAAPPAVDLWREDSP
jgi:hypothetical protein